MTAKHSINYSGVSFNKQYKPRNPVGSNSGDNSKNYRSPPRKFYQKNNYSNGKFQTRNRFQNNSNNKYQYKGGENRNTTNKASIQCHKCKRLGHMKKDCRVKIQPHHKSNYIGDVQEVNENEYVLVIAQASNSSWYHR
jgi:hypothetical protein